MTQAQYAKAQAAVPEMVQALIRSDKALKPWIAQIGHLAVPKRQKFELVDALARSILYQQLHGKAADTIIKRLEALAMESCFSAGTLARLSEAEYRSVGVSANKAKALASLAAFALAGHLPGPRQLASMGNEELIERLSEIRGIGPWTVQMLLLFRLGRTDVWPIDDFGVRKGVQIAHSMAEMPSAKVVKEMAERLWKPNYSLAALYFWRVADLQKDLAKPKAGANLSETAKKPLAKPKTQVAAKGSKKGDAKAI